MRINQMVTPPLPYIPLLPRKFSLNITADLPLKMPYLKHVMM